MLTRKVRVRPLLLQKRLQSVIGGRTLVLVTHRLSMLRIVDRLIVMEGGQIKLDGPRDAVLKHLMGAEEKPAAPPQAQQPAAAQP